MPSLIPDGRNELFSSAVVFPWVPLLCDVLIYSCFGSSRNMGVTEVRQEGTISHGFFSYP